ncbi:MAG: hypothetical protein ACI910_003227 [Oleispira sp.]|jgi:hypothetical protein
MFACLFDSDTLAANHTAHYCHVSQVSYRQIACRLVVTFGGPRTEWLQESNLDRNSRGLGAKGKTDKESGVFHEQQHIQPLGIQEVALLKGSAWEGNEHYALAHRSPHLDLGLTRLLLNLDIF